MTSFPSVLSLTEIQHQPQQSTNDESITPSSSQEQSIHLPEEPLNPRKRRRANLSRIAIGKLSSSNESLNSNGSSAPTGGEWSSEEEPTSSDNDNGLPNGEPPKPTQWPAEKRFCAAQRANHQPNNQEDPSSDEVAIVEGQSGAKSACNVASGGLTLANGLYEIVGDGRECKAVNIQTKTILHCLIMKADEYKTFLKVLERLKSAERRYHDLEEYNQLKNLLIPDQTQAIFGDNGNWYVLLPDHQGNLHSLVNAPNEKTGSGKTFSERRIQPIFKQIVSLVAFCHKIGIYFRDFRLRKFVFIDKERTQIRVNNVLDLWVAAEIADDQIGQRYKSQVCPVYVAPEILMNGVYAGQPADVWALGVLMFSLLTGRFPFHDPNPTALFKRIKARRFSCPITDAISINARWLLHGLLRQSPSERPTAAEILSSHWLQLDPSVLPDGKESVLGQSKGLSINSQSVFSSTLQTNIVGSAPAFVRLNGQTNHPNSVGPTGGLSLQQTAPPPTPSSAIHVRLALVSAGRQPVLSRELPDVQAMSADKREDQMVPELGEVAPGDALVTTVTDHYYTRRPMALSLQSFPPTSNVQTVLRGS